MNETVRAVLDSFESLTDAERHEVTVEVLRRTLRSTPEELSDDALRAAAGELPRELDARETADAQPSSR